VTPHRSHDRGSLVLDREFDGGRIHRASGTKSRALFNQINAMVTTLKTQGRLDVLTALRDKQYTPLYAFCLFKLYGVDRIPTADVLAPLGSTWDAWVKRSTLSPSHKTSLRKTRKALGIGQAHILNDLPARLAVYRSTAPAHSANQARVHVQAFLRDTLGRSHRLWIEVKDMTPAKRKAKPARPILTVDEVRRLVVQLGPKAGEAAWSLAAMGMIPKEYWVDGWEELPDRIRSQGQKRAGRTRDIPKWTRVVQPPLGFSTFRRKLRNVAPGVRPTDFRRAFIRWMEEAGVGVPNQKAYSGHGARNMNELYKMGEVTGQLVGDAEKLRVYAGEKVQTPSLRMEKVG
jgi:hypothetical protein